ncbi:hypothetical protein ILYODFUR_014436 [Ilyodon furcidens]|uniref:Uncharacterized protein n=1 Tax=Ilyodon furcidens TaxID=33524 RepID=A0ABV0TUL2_9TELE
MWQHLKPYLTKAHASSSNVCDDRTEKAFSCHASHTTSQQRRHLMVVIQVTPGGHSLLPFSNVELWRYSSSLCMASRYIWVLIKLYSCYSCKHGQYWVSSYVLIAVF